jgi:hypothetical protein
MPMLQGEQAPGACPCARMKHVAPEIIHGVVCFNLGAKNICQDNLAYVVYASNRNFPDTVKLALIKCQEHASWHLLIHSRHLKKCQELAFIFYFLFFCSDLVRSNAINQDLILTVYSFPSCEPQ